MTSATATKGLAGVVAAETQLSFIDGEKGILEYVGIPIGELSANSTFEETVFLLWNGRLPNRAELAAFTKDLRKRYELPPGMEQRITMLPKHAQPMHVLRTMVSALSLHDSDPNNIDPGPAREKALNILGHAPAPHVLAPPRGCAPRPPPAAPPATQNRARYPAPAAPPGSYSASPPSSRNCNRQTSGSNRRRPSPRLVVSHPVPARRWPAQPPPPSPGREFPPTPPASPVRSPAPPPAASPRPPPSTPLPPE